MNTIRCCAMGCAERHAHHWSSASFGALATRTQRLHRFVVAQLPGAPLHHLPDPAGNVESPDAETGIALTLERGWCVG